MRHFIQNENLNEISAINHFQLTLHKTFNTLTFNQESESSVEQKLWAVLAHKLKHRLKYHLKVLQQILKYYLMHYQHFKIDILNF